MRLFEPVVPPVLAVNLVRTIRPAMASVVGVCDQSGKVIPQLSAGEAEALMASGVASGGMVPKINACLRALTTASIARIVDGRQPHALLKELEGQGSGTTIYK